MQHIVIKFLLFIPEPDPFAAQIVHGRRDREKVLKKLGRDIFVDRIFARQFQGHAHEVERKHSHPTCAVALFETAAIGKLGVAIEDPYVIEPEETALENVVPLRVFAVHPPGEGDQHFMEDRLEKGAVALAGLFAFDLINASGGPGDDWRIDIAEIPFVSGHLAVGMLVPFPHDDIELLLGELGIGQGQGNTVKGQVPRGVPGILPLVRHRHDAFVMQMPPFGVATR